MSDEAKVIIFVIAGILFIIFLGFLNQQFKPTSLRFFEECVEGITPDRIRCAELAIEVGKIKNVEPR